MFGGLHIEMALWNTLDDFLENSGWTAALTEAKVAFSCTASYFLKVAHLAKTTHAHQITLLALKKLQHDAFLQSYLKRHGWKLFVNRAPHSYTGTLF